MDIKDFEPLFGDWYVDSFIGSGSFGKVYKIKREDFGAIYYSALKWISIPQDDAEMKQLRYDGMDNASISEYYKAVVKDLTNEMHLMSRLRGRSCIVSYEDHRIVSKPNEMGYDIFIRMELLTSLNDYMLQHELSRADLIRLGINLCDALELCQKYKIIHRDIKPDNIFVTEIGDFKLGDFGIARQLERTATGLSKKGTYNYMAPEVYKGERYNSSVDIYSLGIVLYRLLNNGRLPFLPPAKEAIRPNDRDLSLVRRMSGEQIVPPQNAEGRLGDIILKACAFDPKDRYSSPQRMREELQAIQYSKDEAKYMYKDGDNLGNIEPSQKDACATHTPTETEAADSAPDYIFKQPIISTFASETNEEAIEQESSERTHSVFENNKELAFDKTGEGYHLNTVSAVNTADYNETESVFSSQRTSIKDSEREQNSSIIQDKSADNNQPSKDDNKRKRIWLGVAGAVCAAFIIWLILISANGRKIPLSTETTEAPVEMLIEQTPSMEATTPMPTEQPDYIITWQDERFESGIRNALGKNQGEAITYYDVKGISVLTIDADEASFLLAEADYSTARQYYSNSTATYESNTLSLADLSNFTGLKSIYIFDTTIADIDALQTCESLESVLFYGSKGISLEWVGALPKLKTLILSFCYDIDFTNMSGSASLDELTFYWCNTPSLDQLSLFSTLKDLSISSLEELTNIESLSALSSLKTLSLGDCKLNNLDFVMGLQQLESFEVYQSTIKDISGLSARIDLKKLAIENCDLLSDLSALSQLEKLTDLFICDCAKVTDVSSISNLKNLTFLWLLGCEKLSDISPLSGLTNLKNLSLLQTNVTDISPLIGLDLEQISVDKDLESKAKEYFPSADIYAA